MKTARIDHPSETAMITTSTVQRIGSLGLVLAALTAISCAGGKPGTYKTPEEAGAALAALAGTGDKAKCEEIFGPGSQEMFRSGDDVADKADAERVKALLTEKVAFEDDDEKTKILLAGNEEWPFPIPLVLEDGRWKFDTAAGLEELANRRVGRNELLTIAALRELVSAQREYRSAGRDGLPVAYAARFDSSPGKHDGLYWPAAEGEPESPLGELVARASAKGYDLPGAPTPEPFNGYYFRMLDRQGKDAPGGERSYLDKKGLMTGGFAAIAWPVEYGKSGVTTFFVSDRGMVFQKNLGPETEALARGVTAYEPDESWDPTPD